LACPVLGLGLEFQDFEKGLGKRNPEVDGEGVIVESDVDLSQKGANALGHGDTGLAHFPAFILVDDKGNDFFAQLM
jgi:hypothetical protein